jgi:transposase
MAPIANLYYKGDDMNAVGIDVSKGTSTVAIIRPFGEIVRKPFDVIHSPKGLTELANLILSLEGESKVVLENTGKYSDPVIKVLNESGIFVCPVNAKLIHDYGGDTIRRDKTDPIDSLKIAGFCLDKWAKLERYIPMDELRKTLKTYNRQLDEYMKIKAMLKNNLISLTDQVFPGVNALFSSTSRESDGHEKWIDFLARFWHCECVTVLSEEAFAKVYAKWCKRNGYNFSSAKATQIYESASNQQASLSKNDFTKTLILQSVEQLNSLCMTIAKLKAEMLKLAKTMPEYDTVIGMHGVGTTLAPQLIAEIGDIRHFPKRASLARFAGIEPPQNQSGSYNQHSRRISKQGPPQLRKTLFQVMRCVLQLSHPNEDTFRFISRKRAEGKPFKVYMIAGANKFLRVYYARVKECMDLAEQNTEILA